jgi:hypothetical protein
MNDKIKKILDELYALEPDLHNREEELAKIIERLLMDKPDTKFDQNFARQLRADLLAQRMPVKTKGVFFMFNRFAYAGLAVVALAAIAGAVYLYGQNTITKRQDLLGVNVHQVADNAFGSLATLSNSGAAGGRGGGGGGSETAQNSPAPSSDLAAPKMAYGMGGGGGIGMPNPEYTQYKYVYHGDPLKLAESQMEVFKKIKGAGSTSDLVRAFSGQNTGLLNLSRFKNLKLQNFSVYEDGPDGYRIDADLFNGTISLSENFTNPKVYEQAGISAKDLPGDADLINLVKQFLNSRNIDISGYGEGEVQKYWQLDRSGSLVNPEMTLNDISVIFPLKINGQEVYDQNGSKYGVMANIRLADRKVTGVWNLNIQQYQSSNYAAETDAARILEIAGRGGVYQGLYNPSFPPTKVVEIELGAPQTVLMQMWNYNNGANDELLVPALVFPVVSIPNDGPIYQKNVVVPLIKEILDSVNSVQPPIMPLEKTK